MTNDDAKKPHFDSADFEKFRKARENPAENDEKNENEALDPENSSENAQDQDLAGKYDALKTEYLRVFADFENVKKRLEREKSQALAFANENFAKDLLPLMDALENAKKAAQSSPQISQGIDFVRQNFTKILLKHGVSEIPTDGDFDPNVHDAIMQVADPKRENGAISEVLQRGYTMNERVLRPAMVSIVKN